MRRAPKLSRTIQTKELHVQRLGKRSYYERIALPEGDFSEKWVVRREIEDSLPDDLKGVLARESETVREYVGAKCVVTASFQSSPRAKRHFLRWVGRIGGKCTEIQNLDGLSYWWVRVKGEINPLSIPHGVTIEQRNILGPSGKGNLDYRRPKQPRE